MTLSSFAQPVEPVLEAGGDVKNEIVGAAAAKAVIDEIFKGSGFKPE